MKKRVSFYKNFGGQSEEVDLNSMLGAIKEGAFEEETKR